MTETVWITVITAACSLATGLFGHWNGARVQKKKLEGDQKLAEEQQPVDQLSMMLSKIESTYSKMLSDSEARRVADVASLVTRIEKIEQDHSKCMEEHLATARQLGELTGRITELRERVNVNTSTNTETKDLAIAADTKADAAISNSQTALLSIPPGKP